MRRLDLKGAPARLRQVEVYGPLLAGLILLGVAIGVSYWSYADYEAFRQRAVITTAAITKVEPTEYENGRYKVTYGTVSYPVDGEFKQSRVLLESCSRNPCSTQGEKRIGDPFEIFYDPHEVTRAVPAADVDNFPSSNPLYFVMAFLGLIALVVGTINLVLSEAQPER
ncbi:hypothetical protein [Actinomadura alba]|uniref:DUF3592 domain-containing protein n=1 Tax=Actinomadura alba TaxID=406431 RepID=A0ABR7M2Q3_9ACTN|nr:hypothetical protein [Actinomadura alba]MBC6471394.1 hypothetical protein [Actinomadura alba]